MTLSIRILLLVLSGIIIPSISESVDLFKYEVSPEDAPKFKKPIGIYSQGETVLFTGEFHTRYDFSLPPARGNLVPKVALEYSTSAEKSIIGRGWRIPLDHISRSLRRGIPKYIGPAGNDSDDEFEFYLEGHSGPLVYVASPSPKIHLYRAKREGVFAKFYYYSEEGTWHVLHPSGKVWVIGTNDSRDADSARIYAWYVKMITDTDGNQIRYSYKQENGVLYPELIEYDQSTVVQVSHSPSVGFSWKDNPSPSQISYKKGYRAIYDAKLLDEIQIGYVERDENGAVKGEYPQRFSLVYSHEAEGSFHKNLTSFIPPQLPKTAFAYHHLVNIFDRETKIPHNQSFADWENNLSVTRIKQVGSVTELRTTSMLIDMDADGDLDLLIVRSSKDDPRVPKPSWGGHGNEWYWLANMGGKWAPKLKSIPVPQSLQLPPYCAGDPAKCPSILLAGDASAITVEHEQGNITARLQELLDINGDGRPDIVAVVGSKIHVCAGTGSGFESVCKLWNAPSDVGVLKLGRTWYAHPISYDDAALLDMNGDGLPDYVVSLHGAGKLAVYLNSGKGFSSNVDYTIPMDAQMPYLIPKEAIRAAEYADNGDALIRDLRDMNGDGLLDLVESGKGITIAYGNGAGFDRQHIITFGGGQISMSISDPGFQSIKHTIVGLHDINADGLTDIIGYYQGEYRAYLNTGSSFTSLQSWKIEGSKPSILHPSLRTVVKDGAKKYYPNSDSDTYIGVKQELLDFDGDGQVELVVAPLSPSSTHAGPGYYFIPYKKQQSYWVVDLPGIVAWQSPTTYLTTKPPAGHDSWFSTQWTSIGTRAVPSHKLERIQSGIGVTTNLVFGHPKTPQSVTPFPVWAVTIMDRHDLATDDHRATYLDSYNPKYDHVLKEFRGFERVVEDQGNIRVVEHSFKQGEYDQGIEDLTRLYEWTKGVPDEKGKLLKSVSRTLDTTSYSDSPRRWTKITAENTDVFDPGGFARHALTEYVYDSTHGVISEIHHQGDTANNKDDRIDKFTYDVLETATAYLVRKKSQTRVNYLGNKVTETDWLFDDQCTNSSSPLSKGRPCSETTWRRKLLPPAVSTYAYDSLGRLEATTDPDQAKTTYTFHGQTPNLKTSTNALGHRIVYDAYHVFSGQPRLTCGPQSDSSGTLRCDRTEYDLYGRPTEIYKTLDDPAAFGNKYKTARVTKLTYNDKGGLLNPTYVSAVDDPDPIEGKLPKREIKVYYDSDGRILKHAHSDRTSWSATYFAYDWFGNLVRGWLPISEAADSSYKRPTLGPHCAPVCIAGYSYYHDLLNRPTGMDGPDGKEVTLDYRGADVWKTDARGYKSKYTVSAFDEIKAIERTVQGVPIRSEFAYDAAGRLTQATDPDGGVYGYVYDGDGSLHRADLPTGSWSYERTPAGKIDLITNADGSTVRYWYDGIGRLRERLVEPGPGLCTATDRQHRQHEIFVYDADSRQIGWLTEVRASDYTISMTYDAQGNVTRKELTDVASGRALKFDKRFTALGDLQQLVYPSGRYITYAYDNAGRLDRVEGIGGCTVTAKLGYHVDGKLEYNQGTMCNLSWNRIYEYDSNQRLHAIKATVGGIAWNIEYQYDRNNNITVLKDDFRLLDHRWFYDEVNRLKEAQGHVAKGGTQAGAYVYTYNRNSSLKTANENGQSLAYQYMDQHNYLLDSITAAQQQTSFVSDPNTGHRCSAQKSSGEHWNYTWTGDGLLASMSGFDGLYEHDTTYSYDQGGNRWKRVHTELSKADKPVKTSQINQYLDDIVEYSGVQSAGGREAKGYVKERVSLPGMICTLPTPEEGEWGECSFMDQMNTAAVFSARTGGVVTRKLAYSPYGRVILLDGDASEAPSFDFNGKLREPPDGLLYYGARYYDSMIGRFVSVEPLRLQGASDAVVGSNTLQPFVYAAANPTTHADPNGMAVETILDAIDIGYSGYQLWRNPSWKNLAYFGWSLGATFVPFVPGAWSARAGGKIYGTVARTAAPTTRQLLARPATAALAEKAVTAAVGSMRGSDEERMVYLLHGTTSARAQNIINEQIFAPLKTYFTLNLPVAQHFANRKLANYPGEGGTAVLRVEVYASDFKRLQNQGVIKPDLLKDPAAVRGKMQWIVSPGGMQEINRILLDIQKVQ